MQQNEALRRADPILTKQLAGQALIDERTVRRFLEGRPTKPMTKARIVRALAAMGLPTVVAPLG